VDSTGRRDRLAKAFRWRFIASSLPHPLSARSGQCSEASWVAPLTTEILQERVDVKKNRLPHYRARGYDEYWLLICAHPINPACQFEATRDFDPAQVLSPFDRSFFYNCWQTLSLEWIPAQPPPQGCLCAYQGVALIPKRKAARLTAMSPTSVPVRIARTSSQPRSANGPTSSKAPSTKSS